MTSRREFLRQSGALVASAAIPTILNTTHVFSREHSGSGFKTQRPNPSDRTFRSDAVEAILSEVSKSISDAELRWLFENCFPNTLDTTIRFHGMRNGKPDTFVITGDIPAMWLRDSAAQVTPYIPLCKDDKPLSRLIQGVIHRQVACVLIDPYANAFNFDDKEPSRWHKDKTAMRNELHERKWEIDSLCYLIRLSYLFWKETGKSDFMDREWHQAMKRIVETFREQQRLKDNGSYRFQREYAAWYGDFIANDGLGLPTRKVGLIHSAFRPSDDACLFPFLIPSNFFAMVSLRQLAEMLEKSPKHPVTAMLAAEAKDIASTLEGLLKEHAIVSHLSFGKCYAFETDGFGNHYFMDDGNIPSLIALPYLGAVAPTDPIYQNTRRFILSPDHMYYFKGKAGEGYGGPHAGWEMIWHLGIIARALTATDDDEILSQLRQLKSSHAGTGFMHEAFHKDDDTQFTRKWFAWANTLFGELIITLYQQRPSLLKRV